MNKLCIRKTSTYGGFGPNFANFQEKKTLVQNYKKWKKPKTIKNLTNIV